MIFSNLLINKKHITSILITLLLTIPISIYSTEAISAANIKANEKASKTKSSKSNKDKETVNSTAIITGIDSGSVTEDVDPDNDGLLETNGKLNITDSDAGESAFIANITTSSYGHFELSSDGNWSYNADNNQPVIQNLTSTTTLTDTLVISSIDGTTHNITVTIYGAEELNTPAVINGIDSGSVTEDIDHDNDGLLETSGKLNITDSDAGESAFIANITTSSYGHFELSSDGNWSYNADNNQPVIQNLTSTTTLTDTLVISSIDGTTHNITVIIYGAEELNTPAVINGIDSGSVTEDVDPDNDGLLESSGKLNITDSDAGESAFIANITTSSYGHFELSSDGNWSYNADNNQPVIQNLTSTTSLTDHLLISSIDGTTHDIIVTIYGSDEISNSQSDIVITWLAPSERENNNPISLSEIAGYRIYYGNSLGQYMNDVTINDSSAVSHTFTDLTASTYYFVVTTLDTEGRESLYSNEVVITN